MIKVQAGDVVQVAGTKVTIEKVYPVPFGSSSSGQRFDIVWFEGHELKRANVARIAIKGA